MSSRSVWRLAPDETGPGGRGIQRVPTEKPKLEAPFQLAVEKQWSLVQQGRPYLRHSWHRIDCLSIVSYWIMFALCLAGAESTAHAHIFIFRALSVLRVSRLLAVTSGTAVSFPLSQIWPMAVNTYKNPHKREIKQTIMRSLKKAAPLLARVAVFILFAMVLFS